MEYSEYQQGYEDPLPNYKIPRKKDMDMNTIENYTTPLNWGPPVTNIDSTGSTSNLGQYYSSNSNTAPVTYNINAYKRPIEKEVPKNIVKNKRPFLDTCPDLSDSTLPKELTSQFQPLFCKLCQARLYSNTNAMLHYKSKNHDKKVRNFLTQHSETTGEPLHKRAKMKREDNLEDDDPRNKHCDICDMDFTSKMHADQHYMGRNHHKALLNKKPPPNCILGEDGKWHRVQKVAEDPSGRNGIGLAFAKPEELQPNNKGKFHCTICNVFATSQENIDTHYKGQKHKKMLNKLGGQKEMVIENTYEMQYYKELKYEDMNTTPIFNKYENLQMDCDRYYNPLTALSTGSTSDKSQSDAWDPSSEFVSSDGPQIGAWEPISSPQPERKSTSICRTPSGQYYCQVCNLSLNSEVQFLQHLESKRHLKNKQAMAAIKSSAH